MQLYIIYIIICVSMVCRDIGPKVPIYFKDHESCISVSNIALLKGLTKYARDKSITDTGILCLRIDGKKT